MSSSRTSIVSILNNVDHPSFAVRSNSRLGRAHAASPHSQPEQLCQPTEETQSTQHTHSPTPSKSTASPRGTRHPFDPVTEATLPTSPGSSEGSVYDYFSSQPSSSTYHPYARQDPRRESYRFPSRGPAAPRTPPERQSASTTALEASTSQSGGTRGTGRKNKYPCPYAASHGCSATFTTSGHAARHGKKHTGEKSVHCPICNKAFTRKDNMKQHIRTHRTHSDDMRSTSEPETDARWVAARPDSGYRSAAHRRTISQITEPEAISPTPASAAPPYEIRN